MTTPPNFSALFDNAMSSIRMGIEDYAQDKPERSLSAVRNFYAGLLLLAKEVLVRHIPNADPAPKSLHRSASANGSKSRRPHASRLPPAEAALPGMG